MDRNYFWYYLFLIVPLAAFLSKCQNQKEQAGSLAYRGFNLVSYNVRYNNPADGENAWPYRKEKVAGLLHFHKTDIAGLQEVLKSQLNDLALLMPDFGWFGVGRTDGDSLGEYAPVFYRKTRFKVLEWDAFWLSETPDIPSKGWDAALNRIVTWGAMEDRHSGKRFYIFNTHFDHMGETARQESAVLLLNKVESIAGPAPAVITGDFNFTSTSDPYQILTDASDPWHIRDALQVSERPHYGPVSTFGGGFDEACKDGEKIDYIYVKNQVRVIRHGILTDSWAGICPSDHMPVFSEITIR